MNDDDLTILICETLGHMPGWNWWETSTPYPVDEVGIYYGDLPADGPDQAIGVSVYDAQDPLHLSWRNVQLRIRGKQRDKRSADKLGSFAFIAMQRLSRVGGISDTSRISFAPLGADGNAREERTENYIIILDNPEVTAS